MKTEHMDVTINRKPITAPFILLLLISSIASAEPNKAALDAVSVPRHFSVVNGTIKFVAVTNVMALAVEGQSNEMNAEVILDGSGAALELASINAKADP